MKTNRTEATTAIAPGTRVKGTLRGAEDLVVRGRIEGNIELSASLVVESTGVVKADVHAERVTVSGIVVGDITASGAVEITAEGRVLGDLTAPTIRVAEGARLRGGLNVGGKERVRPPAPRPAVTPVKVTKPAAARPEPEPAADERRRTTVTSFTAPKSGGEDKRRKRVLLKKRR